ncbi:hypothetical protein ACH5RR_035984 [Cinchona calisaya]|uniref:J domain-containing protein n=1 Tax=Cinchona calisaya TaxID=153742 RepID=A0ABD2Y6V6_9GENT
MSGTSVTCSQPRPCSGSKTLRRCWNRRETDDVVLIDVDSDSFDNVIIIDVPESLTKRSRGTSVLRNNKKGSWETVICLDDDENTDNIYAHSGVKVDENLDTGGSSSKSSCPVSGNFASISSAVADDCQVIHESMSPVKLWKCKRTYFGKGSARNRYGLGADTVSCSSESDYLDCELMVGPFGTIREQWEKASLKRKCDNHIGQPGVEDPAVVFSEAHQNVNVANVVEKEPSMLHCQHSVNDEVDHGKPIFGDKGTNLQETVCMSNLHGLQQETKHRVDSSKEKLVSEQALAIDPRSSDNYVTETFLSQRNNRLDHHPHSSEQIPESPSTTSSLINSTQPVQSQLCSVNVNEESGKLVLNSQMEDARDDPVHGLGAGVMLNSEGCIFIGREKLKETDKFKKALEEELASRRRALQIQAEEAQKLWHLQKRKKAESMRLLDMERRQKQRVEEIRETQKKDEENMNLKEVIRAAVRKELKQLELTCHDMASVLQGLGVLVGVVGQHPSLNEVRLAYKRALLTFHPDRASGSEVRQQVEAEEKFKLISRMKEKFLPTWQTF